MLVPLIDLRAQYLRIKREVEGAIQEVLLGGNFIGGQEVSEFEEDFADKSKVKYCISVANGTDALYIAMKVLGIEEGDEVITTASSWFSTAYTISQIGATPVFVDVDAKTYNIDPVLLEKKITPKTKAVIPVHLYGQMADMKAIRAICDKHDLYCIEDSAQAHLSSINDVRPGQLGDLATFSFYPTKNLGAYGDAGCIVTNDDKFASKCRTFANYAGKGKGTSFGINSRMDTLQAVILHVKLEYVDDWIIQRIAHAKRYNQLLSNIEQVQVPQVSEGARHTYYTYSIQCENRDELQKYLLEKEITTAVHYPTILPMLPAYNYLDYKSTDFPVALNHQKETLSLPMYPELTNDQMVYVVDCIADFYN